MPLQIAGQPRIQPLAGFLGLRDWGLGLRDEGLGLRLQDLLGGSGALMNRIFGANMWLIDPEKKRFNNIRV